MQRAGMCAAADLPVHDDVVALRYSEQYLELRAGESRQEVLEVYPVLFSVHRAGRAWPFCHEAIRFIGVGLAQVAGIPSIKKGMCGFDVLLLRHSAFSPSMIVVHFVAQRIVG